MKTTTQTTNYTENDTLRATKDEGGLVCGVTYIKPDPELVRGVTYDDDAVSLDEIFSGMKESDSVSAENEVHNTTSKVDVPATEMVEQVKENSSVTTSKSESELVRGVTYDDYVNLDKKFPGMKESDSVSEKNEVNDTALKVDVTVAETVKQNLSVTTSKPIYRHFTLKKLREPTPVTKSSLSEVTSTLNFDLVLICREIHVLDQEEGEVKICYYNMRILIITMKGEQLEYTYKVSADKVKDFNWVKTATNSLAHIPSDKEERLEFQAMVQRAIEVQEVPTMVYYSTPVWRYIDGKGWRFVYSEGVVGEADTIYCVKEEKYKLLLKKEMINQKNLFEVAMDMVKITKNGRTALALFLFTHMACLETIFEEAGFPIHFVFGLTGVTNSRKTSLALTLGQVYNRKELKADAEFTTATNAGIEKHLSTYKDGVVIIDDFKPGITKRQQSFMDQKLDELVRFYGNRVSKKRMRKPDPNSARDYYPIYGGCVVTMEIVTGVLSSISRLFLTDLSIDDVDNERLGYYQNNRWILSTHMYGFLTWATANFDVIKKYIAENVPVLRGNCNFEFLRYGEMYAMFFVMANIIAEYAKTFNFWNTEEAQAFVALVHTSISEELCIMSCRSSQYDKGRLALDALRDSLTSSRLVPLELNRDTISKCANCYEDECFLYIRTTELKRIANEYVRFYHLPYDIHSEEEVIGLLERMQLLEIKETTKGRERSRKLPMSKGNGLRYLYIRKDSLQQYFDN